MIAPDLHWGNEDRSSAGLGVARDPFGSALSRVSAINVNRGPGSSRDGQLALRACYASTVAGLAAGSEALTAPPSLRGRR
jgi:hypothetical protein